METTALGLDTLHAVNPRVTAYRILPRAYIPRFKQNTLLCDPPNKSRLNAQGGCPCTVYQLNTAHMGQALS